MRLDHPIQMQSRILYCMSSMRPSLLTALQGCLPPVTHAEAMASATLVARAFLHHWYLIQTVCQWASQGKLQHGSKLVEGRKAGGQSSWVPTVMAYEWRLLNLGGLTPVRSLSSSLPFTAYDNTCLSWPTQGAVHGTGAQPVYVNLKAWL